MKYNPNAANTTAKAMIEYAKISLVSIFASASFLSAMNADYKREPGKYVNCSDEGQISMGEFQKEVARLNSNSDYVAGQAVGQKLK